MAGVKKLAILLFAACAAFGAGILRAEVRLPEIFSDGMVFQRQKPVKIWGTAEPGADVKVEFAGNSGSAKAGKDGKWSLFLGAMEASAEPREMRISENGKPAKTVKNILVGEVWILGGQSNMEWVLANTDDAKEAVARSGYPALRYFKMDSNRIEEKEQYFIPGARWIASNPKDSGGFSAVGFYFGEALLKDLKVPVGLVNVCKGGTSMRAWTPAEYIDNVPFNKRWMVDYNKKRADYLANGGYEKRVEMMKGRRAKYEAACKKADAEGKPRPSAWEYGVSVPLKFAHVPFNEIPIWHWNAKVAPVAGYSARGVLWYQGESDGWGENPKYSPSFVFGEMYANMARAWRERWGCEKLFFLAAQLPSKGGAPAWPRVRAQQISASDEIGAAACANIIDTGAENDVHPRDKTLVGRRLEKVALNSVYGDKSVLPTPRAVSAEYRAGGAAVGINSFGGKLEGRGQPRGFELKIGGKWVAAKPELKGGSSVWIASPDGKSVPEGVRYLWKPWAKPDVWIYNSQNAPLFPFKFEK